jgi:hypothetical protein
MVSILICPQVISNLNNFSKILERVFLSRLQPHITSSVNFNPLQSAYRKSHSTETALLNSLNHIYSAADQSQPTVLVSLDLSAAFDTIDHSTLLSRLYINFGVAGAALSWISAHTSLVEVNASLLVTATPMTSLSLPVGTCDYTN